MAQSIPAELIEKLWRDPEARSRNRNFVRFRDDLTYRLAVHHIRALLAFRDDLMAYQKECSVIIKWLAAGKAAQITLLIPHLHYRRSLFVSTLELELLRGDPAFGDVEISFVEESPSDHDKKL